jgi:hypothetical protein
MSLSTSINRLQLPQPVMRFATGLLIIILLATWIGGLPYYIINLRTDPDIVLRILFNDAWTPQALHTAAADLGVQASFLGWYWLGIEIVMMVGFCSAGLLMFFRKKDNFGLFLSLIFILVGTRITGPVTFSLTFGLPWVFEINEFLSVYSFLGFASLMFLFPNGRFVPTWTAWLMPILVLLAVLISQTGRHSMTANITGFLGYLLSLSIGIASQVYRYRIVATPQEKLQMKWALASIILYLIFGLSIPVFNFNIVDHSRTPAAHDLVEWMVFFVLLTVGINLFIFALAIAVFRYQLYNIDVIIRRTLVYSIVTAALALVFFGSVVLFQSLFLTMTGEQSQLAIVISTLAIAALFTPIRRRAQEIIDRRFYRQKYDTARMLAAFRESLRDNLDLEDLNRDLHSVIQKTLQPSSQMIWFKQSKGRLWRKEFE